MKNLNYFLLITTILLITNCQKAKENAVNEKENTSIDSLKIKAEKATATQESITYNTINSLFTEDLNKDIRRKNIKNVTEILDGYSPKNEEAEGDYNYSISSKNISENIIDYQITETGVMDDAIYGVKTIIQIDKSAINPKIISIKTAYKCREGRGHQNWSKESCK